MYVRCLVAHIFVNNYFHSRNGTRDAKDH